MSDIQITVRSNLDALSAEKLHQSLIDLVEETITSSTEFLRAVEPKRTGAMIEHTTHTHAVEDLVGTIEARLGISAIGESSVPGLGGTATSPRFDLKPSDSSHYPLFVDTGTGVFGPTSTPIFARTGRVMAFEEDGRQIFAHSVAGQRGQHFMAQTLAFAQAFMRSDPRIRVALDEMAVRAAAMLPETLA